MTCATARKLLREAKATGFCPCCFAGNRSPGDLTHEAGCKIVNDACLKRRPRGSS